MHLSTRNVFFISLLVALLLQGSWWWTQSLYDAHVWGMQPVYMLEGNPEQFNASKAYGHPGGPIIIATFGFLAGLGTDPYTSLILALTTLMGITIAVIGAWTYVLWREWALTAMVVVTLTAHPLYVAATPPSALAAVLATLLLLATYHWYTRQAHGHMVLIWGSIAGILIATRADIGMAVSLALAAALVGRLGFMRMAASLGAALVAFLLLDPFLWTMPLAHLYDLGFKAYYHYAMSAPNHISLAQMASFSVPTIVAVVLGGVCSALKHPLFPRPLYACLLLSTLVLGSIFLSAQHQAVRYFMPLIFMWETLLPVCLYLLSSRRDVVGPRFGTVHYRLALSILSIYPLVHFLIRVA